MTWYLTMSCWLVRAIHDCSNSARRSDGSAYQGLLLLQG